MTWNRNGSKEDRAALRRCCADSVLNKYPAPAKMQRCRLLFLSGLVVALLLMLIRPLHADDDLLDPGKVGAGRKAVQSEGLLDPTRPAARSGSTAGGASSRPGSNHQPPGYARGMAGSVVRTMDSLTRAAADLIDEILKIEERIRELEGKLQTLRAEKEAMMEEYRNGLFCSGCNRTKSEILVTGSTFPHPGQSIIRPTPEQIAAKERELQEPIDRLSRELQELRATLLKICSERDEAVLQIGYGLSLWRCAISYENALIWQNENESIAAYKSARDKTDDQLVKLQLEMFSEKNKVKFDLMAGEKQMWLDEQDKLERQRATERRAWQNALQQATVSVNNEKTQLEIYLARERLSQFVTAVPISSFVGTISSPYNLGIKYRMGSYRVADNDQVLPAVNRFINDFRQSPGPPAAEVAAPGAGVPAQNGVIVPKLKGVMRDLLICDPATGKCPPSAKPISVGPPRG